MEFDMIAPEEIDDYIGKPGYLIIDLRAREDFKTNHVESAVNIPYESLKETDPLKSAVLILYCERGPTSFRAARELAARGYRVKAMVGGMHAYQRMKQNEGKISQRY